MNKKELYEAPLCEVLDVKWRLFSFKAALIR